MKNKDEDGSVNLLERCSVNVNASPFYRGFDSASSALGWAARTGMEELAEHLIAQGADLKENNPNRHNFTPFHDLCDGPDLPSFVKLLIDAGADVNGLSNGNYSPIMVCSYTFRLEMM